MHSLLETLRPMVPTDFNLEALRAIEPPSENSPDSCYLSALILPEDQLDPDVELFQKLVTFVELQMKKMEDHVNANRSKMCLSNMVPCMVEKSNVSIFDLRRVSLDIYYVAPFVVCRLSCLLLTQLCTAPSFSRHPGHSKMEGLGSSFLIGIRSL